MCTWVWRVCGVLSGEGTAVLGCRQEWGCWVWLER